MNAALAMLLTLAARRWTWRWLASAVLLAAVIVAGYRIQPPWWETASDIREMSDAVADGTGYEGTDEYVPAGADSYELNKNLPLVSDDAGAPVPSQMLAWQPMEKHFRVQAAAPQNLTLRLFNYPAWDVIVNGKHVQDPDHRCHRPVGRSHCCRKQRCTDPFPPDASTVGSETSSR